MKYLQILNLTLAALAATFALVLGVVGILYSVHTDTSAAVARELPALLRMTAVFALCTGVAGVAWWAHRREHGAAWAVQAFFFLSLIVAAQWLGRTLGIES